MPPYPRRLLVVYLTLRAMRRPQLVGNQLGGLRFLYMYSAHKDMPPPRRCGLQAAPRSKERRKKQRKSKEKVPLSGIPEKSLIFGGLGTSKSPFKGDLEGLLRGDLEGLIY